MTDRITEAREVVKALRDRVRLPNTYARTQHLNTYMEYAEAERVLKDRAADALEALIEPPTDDEREALARSEAIHTLADFMEGWYDRWAGPGEEWTLADMARGIIEWQADQASGEDSEALDQIIRDADGYWPDAREAILAAGFRRQGPVTDAARDALPPEADATPDEAFDLGWIAGYDAAKAEPVTDEVEAARATR